MARRVPNGGTNARHPNVDGAPLAESTRRDTRSRSMQRMVRRFRVHGVALKVLLPDWRRVRKQRGRCSLDERRCE